MSATSTEEGSGSPSCAHSDRPRVGLSLTPGFLFSRPRTGSKPSQGTAANPLVRVRIIPLFGFRCRRHLISSRGNALVYSRSPPGRTPSAATCDRWQVTVWSHLDFYLPPMAISAITPPPPFFRAARWERAVLVYTLVILTRDNSHQHRPT
ncbi:hypothetical protein LY76DRAFT_202443 [Colletotrichum caudatum]|nr:hypothetical protein LY76DRAFT_202443 [Colletotrichum caudatum]